MKSKSLSTLTLATILLLLPANALALKGKYDKVRGLTEYKTTEMIANYSFWAGSYIFYRMVALHSEETANGK